MNTLRRNAKVPRNRPLQRTSNSSFQLNLIAIWRHTWARWSGLLSLLLAAERRSVRRLPRNRDERKSLNLPAHIFAKGDSNEQR